MVLSPGEVFEHTHHGESTTTLIEGSVDLFVEGSRQALVAGLPTPVPARVSHVLVNTGVTPAIVECAHRNDGIPS